uniref:arf-GAP with dual PH domain-containing protein 1-like isoform X2 n=1 Tax=Styela clava TaxID=7725 RepID=UPI00193A5BBB|nr:arf-GAP with dual PH domain-containing protein 1-like isoform X2 [Styela clava]
MGERNKKILLEQLQIGKNKYCADCNAPDPEWASSNVGVFVCVNCSGIHRMLGTHISRVKSCKLDQWDDDSVAFMCERGNEVVNDELEKYLPVYYHKPVSSDPQVYKEQFIQSKYNRKEFKQPGGPAHYEKGRLVGNLHKRGKEDKQYRVRKFVLDANEGTLKYYIKQEAKEPKQSIPLTTLHATLSPEIIDHPNGLQLSFLVNGVTRHIYLYADNGKEAVDWYITIRATVYSNLKEQYSELSNEEIIKRMARNQQKQGWMSKTGPKKTEPYRKRWFVLDDRRLLYFTQPLEAYPKGAIYLGNRQDGYIVRDGLPAGQQESGYGITVTTPERDFLLLCEDQEEQRSWIAEIKNVLTRPLSEQDNKAETAFLKKKKKKWFW